MRRPQRTLAVLLGVGLVALVALIPRDVVVAPTDHATSVNTLPSTTTHGESPGETHHPEGGEGEPHGEASVQLEDLGRVVEGDGAAEFRQIHHGIYRVVGRRSGVLFALKTECRPAAKWHGQQGYPEVAVHSFGRLLLGRANSVPAARGVLVALNTTQAAELHRDRCGLLSAADLAAWRPAPPPAAKGTVYVAGAALAWRAAHNEDALPPRSTASWWAPKGPLLTAQVRETAAQLSDVLVLDYALANEDREDKNWFHGRSQRYIAMDNGWAFAGPAYKGSVCAAPSSALQCPGLLRYLGRSRQCPRLRWCRFRRSTAATVRRLAGSGDAADDEHSLPPWTQRWRAVLRADPLIAWLLRRHGATVTARGQLRYSEALARYVQGCPSGTAGGDGLVDGLALGVHRRLRALAAHIDDCVAAHGAAYVYGE